MSLLRNAATYLLIKVIGGALYCANAGVYTEAGGHCTGISFTHSVSEFPFLGYTHTQKALLARSGNHQEDVRKSQQFSNVRPSMIAFNLHNIFRDLACECKLLKPQSFYPLNPAPTLWHWHVIAILERSLNFSSSKKRSNHLLRSSWFCGK